MPRGSPWGAGIPSIKSHEYHLLDGYPPAKSSCWGLDGIWFSSTIWTMEALGRLFETGYQGQLGWLHQKQVRIITPAMSKWFLYYPSWQHQMDLCRLFSMADPPTKKWLHYMKLPSCNLTLPNSLVPFAVRGPKSQGPTKCQKSHSRSQIPFLHYQTLYSCRFHPLKHV